MFTRKNARSFEHDRVSSIRCCTVLRALRFLCRHVRTRFDQRTQLYAALRGQHHLERCRTRGPGFRGMAAMRIREPAGAGDAGGLDLGNLSVADPGARAVLSAVGFPPSLSPSVMKHMTRATGCAGKVGSPYCSAFASRTVTTPEQRGPVGCQEGDSLRTPRNPCPDRTGGNVRQFVQSTKEMWARGVLAALLACSLSRT